MGQAGLGQVELGQAGPGRAGRADAMPWLDRTVDVDTHEMVPFHLWAEEFGESVAETMAPFAASPRFTDNGVNSIVRPALASSRSTR